VEAAGAGELVEEIRVSMNNIARQVLAKINMEFIKPDAASLLVTNRCNLIYMIRRVFSEWHMWGKYEDMHNN
jgi:hypothetical protein